MQLNSDGFIISLSPFSNSDFIAKIFTKDFGIISGIIKSGLTRKNKILLGSFGSLSWNARLESQLGVFHFEEQKNLIAKFINYSKASFAVSTMLALIESFLPEREKYEELFYNSLDFIENLNNLDNIKINYLNWEINFLKSLGYAINTSKCCNCSSKENLIYISPKTGRAVCENCAKGFENKLLKLPISLDITKRLLLNISKDLNKNLPNL